MRLMALGVRHVHMCSRGQIVAHHSLFTRWRRTRRSARRRRWLWLTLSSLRLPKLAEARRVQAVHLTLRLVLFLLGFAARAARRAAHTSHTRAARTPTTGTPLLAHIRGCRDRTLQLSFSRTRPDSARPRTSRRFARRPFIPTTTARAIASSSQHSGLVN